MTAQRKILIIDDEPDIREVAKLSLKITKHWDIVSAGSGDEGVRIALEERPDAILLDVLMPIMNGLATLKSLKSYPETQVIPVILLTATVKKAIQEDFFYLGAQGILIKPFDPGLLGEQIESILGWTNLNMV
ncbi:MAG: response regulator [Thainema sp.]